MKYPVHRPVAILTMGDVQNLRNALQQSEIPRIHKVHLDRKLSDMQAQLRVCVQLVVR